MKDKITQYHKNTEEYCRAGETTSDQDVVGRLRRGILYGLVRLLERLDMAPVGVLGDVYGDNINGGGGGLGGGDSILRLRVL